MGRIKLSVIFSICLSVLLTSYYTPLTNTYYALQTVSRAQSVGDSVVFAKESVTERGGHYVYEDNILNIRMKKGEEIIRYSCTNLTASPISFVLHKNNPVE
jgi:hypothetical protein